MKKLIPFLILLLAGVVRGQEVPLYNARLTSNLNGGAQAITNVSDVVTTGGVSLASIVASVDTGLPARVTAVETNLTAHKVDPAAHATAIQQRISDSGARVVFEAGTTYALEGIVDSPGEVVTWSTVRIDAYSALTNTSYYTVPAELDGCLADIKAGFDLDSSSGAGWYVFLLFNGTNEGAVMQSCVNATTMFDLEGVTLSKTVTLKTGDDYYWVAYFTGANGAGDTGNIGVDSFFQITLLNPAPQANDFNYVVANGEATITGYKGAGGAVVIPDSIYTNPVAQIGASAFASNGLTSATIPASVTNIADLAFDSCTSMTGAYFYGNAPALGADVFTNVTATVYYLTGATGYDTNFGGLTTAVWTP
jgi:hypothetical protein